MAKRREQTVEHDLDERVTLAPLEFEEALRQLLHSRPDEPTPETDEPAP